MHQRQVHIRTLWDQSGHNGMLYSRPRLVRNKQSVKIQASPLSPKGGISFGRVSQGVAAAILDKDGTNRKEYFFSFLFFDYYFLFFIFYFFYFLQ